MPRINIDQYNRTDTHIHKAVQILAFLGKQLGHHQADDSHTTIHLEHSEHALMGKPILINDTPHQAVLHLLDYKLIIKSKSSSIIIDVEDQMVAAIVQQIKDQLNIEQLSDFALHYDLPVSYDLNQEYLVKPTPNAMEDWIFVRQLARKAMIQVNEIIKPISPINIWPHHFDTGTYHVLSKNTEGVDVSSVGCGFAVKDTIVPEPYFYIYGWHKDKTIDYSQIPTLKIGAWKMGTWNGAVVPLSEVLELNDPLADLTNFYQETFAFFKKQL